MPSRMLHGTYVNVNGVYQAQLSEAVIFCGIESLRKGRVFSFFITPQRNKPPSRVPRLLKNRSGERPNEVQVLGCPADFLYKFLCIMFQFLVAVQTPISAVLAVVAVANPKFDAHAFLFYHALV